MCVCVLGGIEGQMGYSAVIKSIVLSLSYPDTLASIVFCTNISEAQSQFLNLIFKCPWNDLENSKIIAIITQMWTNSILQAFVTHGPNHGNNYNQIPSSYQGSVRQDKTKYMNKFP